jgi:pyridine nucleotide-disulfide oxidoreductase family protein
MKRLLLLGAGHAHLHVLQSLAREPLAGVQVTLVSPFVRQMYSGMVPGWMAGRYRLEDCAIALPPLVRDSQVRWYHNKVVALDVDARRVRLADGERLGFDILSVDTGSVMDGSRVRGAPEHGLMVRPIEDFAQRWTEVIDRAEGGVALTVAVVGAGAAGVELALAAAARLGNQGRTVLVTGGSPPLDGHSALARRLAASALRRARVVVMRMPCLEVSARHVHLAGADGGRIDVPCDAAIIATGSQPPRWLPESGLTLDPQGCIATGPTLQSVSHPEVFAAGDVAGRIDRPVPKSGVFAVRAGPPLAQNLRRAVAAQALQRHLPSPWSLNLLACGDDTAIASWGPLAVHGAWAWRWKDRIDRAFLARFNPAAVVTDEASANVMAGAIDPEADAAAVASIPAGSASRAPVERAPQGPGPVQAVAPGPAPAKGSEQAAPR